MIGANDDTVEDPVSCKVGSDKIFKVAQFISQMQLLAPNIHFERLALTCHEVTFDQFIWFHKHSGSLSINRTHVVRTNEKTKGSFDEPDLHRPLGKELTLIQPCFSDMIDNLQKFNYKE